MPLPQADIFKEEEYDHIPSLSHKSLKLHSWYCWRSTFSGIQFYILPIHSNYQEYSLPLSKLFTCQSPCIIWGLSQINMQYLRKLVLDFLPPGSQGTRCTFFFSYNHLFVGLFPVLDCQYFKDKKSLLNFKCLIECQWIDVYRMFFKKYTIPTYVVYKRSSP